VFGVQESLQVVEETAFFPLEGIDVREEFVVLLFAQYLLDTNNTSKLIFSMHSRIRLVDEQL